MNKTAKYVLISLLITLTSKANAQYDQIPQSFGKCPFDFRNLEGLAQFSDDDTIKPFFSNDKFYYKNTSSKKLINNIGFDEAYPFLKNYAVIKINGRYGIIDKSGNMAVKPEYTQFNIRDDRSILILSDRVKDKSYQFDFNTGELKEAVFFEDELYFPQNKMYKVNGKYGVQFEDGSKTAAIYDTVLYQNYKDFIVVKAANKIGAINKKGAFIIPLIYNDSMSGYPDRVALRASKKWDYFVNCKLIFSSKNKPILWRYNKIIFKSGDYYGCMNDKGNQILAAKYKWISLISPIAIDKNNNLVFYNNDSPDFIYYKLNSHNK